MKNSSNLVCRRYLSGEGAPSRRLMLSVFKPERMDAHTWGCMFVIRKKGSIIKKVARGVDSVDALLNAFEGIRVALEPSCSATLFMRLKVMGKWVTVSVPELSLIHI